jgi:hypothetical protein
MLRRMPFPTLDREARRQVEGKQRLIKLGDQPSDGSYTTEEENQANKQEHVIYCTHNQLAAANLQDWNQPTCRGFKIHRDTPGRIRSASQWRIDSLSRWLDFGTFHGSTIASKPCRRNSVFARFWIQ